MEISHGGWYENLPWQRGEAACKARSDAHLAETKTNVHVMRDTARAIERERDKRQELRQSEGKKIHRSSEKKGKKSA